MVARDDALVRVPEDLLQLIVERGGRGDSRAPQFVARGAEDRAGAQLGAVAPHGIRRLARRLRALVLFAVDYFRHALRLAQLGPEDALDVCLQRALLGELRGVRELEVRVTSLADLVVETRG